MTFGFIDLDESLHATSGIHRAAARARPICLRVFMAVRSLKSQVDAHEPSIGPVAV